MISTLEDLSTSGCLSLTLAPVSYQNQEVRPTAQQGSGWDHLLQTAAVQGPQGPSVHLCPALPDPRDLLPASPALSCPCRCGTGSGLICLAAFSQATSPHSPPHPPRGLSNLLLLLAHLHVPSQAFARPRILSACLQTPLLMSMTSCAFSHASYRLLTSPNAIIHVS